MNPRAFAPFVLLVCLGSHASAQEILTPAATITVDGIPPVPRELAEEVDRYGNYRSASFAQWHPERLEMLITTRFGETAQVHRVTQPMGMREQLTFFSEPVRGVGDYVDDSSFILGMDVGGNEFFQLYRFDPATGERELLTDGEHRHSGGLRSKATGLIEFQRVDADQDGAFTEFWTADPMKPESAKKIATMRGGGWGATDWSPDGKQLLLNEYISVADSRIWLMDAATGDAKKILPRAGQSKAAYRGGQFDPKGRFFYTTTNDDSEFMRLRSYDFDGRVSKTLTQDIPWDIEDFDLSPDGRRMAYTFNEAGAGRWAIASAETGEIQVGPSGGPLRLTSGLQWHSDSDHLAFTSASARRAGDVFVVQASTGELVQWTKSETGLTTGDWPDAEAISWKSFDGREITGFVNRPPARFTGIRPCVVIIHGGPEGQSRPGFLGRWNYFLNELGIALIYPNVRGSTGYGKTFADLDNGMKREDTYSDIGALLDWIDEQPGLDPARVMIYGGSYGGHMTLAVATRYSERIAASVNLFGISNLRSFLENTQGYRRDLRRAEYGDERDPEVRAWMEKTAPMVHVDQIRKPMLVQQGVNDPRVPKSESDQIVAALKQTGTPVWYLVFADEGHGFLKKPNADFAFYTTAMFAREHLLGE